MNFSEGNAEILAEDAPEEEKAAQMDTIDKEMVVYGGEKIPRDAIDTLMTGLKGNDFINEHFLHL